LSAVICLLYNDQRVNEVHLSGFSRYANNLRNGEKSDRASNE